MTQLTARIKSKLDPENPWGKLVKKAKTYTTKRFVFNCFRENTNGKSIIADFGDGKNTNVPCHDHLKIWCENSKPLSDEPVSGESYRAIIIDNKISGLQRLRGY